MWFRQLRGSDYYDERRVYLFVMWNNVNILEDYTYTSGGQDISDRGADWDFTTNKNKRSFKLQLIY